MNIIEIITLELAAYAMLAPLYVALPKYKGSALVLKMATFYLVGLTIQQLSVNLLRYEKQNNFFLYHIGNMAESITLLLMYREIFKKYVADTNKYVYRKIFTLLMLLFVVFANSLPNGVGLLPPMAWNSWNMYACAG